jgi:hypothetical protein
MERTATVSFIILVTPPVVLCEKGMKETTEGLKPLFTVVGVIPSDGICELNWAGKISLCKL